MGLVVFVPIEYEDEDLAVYVSSATHLTDGTLGAGMGGSEQISVEVLAYEGSEPSPIETAGGHVLLAGDETDDDPWPGSTSAWLCGAQVQSDEASMLSTDPNIPFTSDVDPVATSAFEPEAEWTASRSITVPDELAVSPEQTVSGIGCVRVMNKLGSNDAGDRWFSPTTFQIAVAFTEGGEISRPDDEREFVYGQMTDVVTPNSWTQVSGFTGSDGEEIGGGYLDDLLSANGSADVTLPVEVARPGSVPTLVYVDTAVQRAIEQRLAAGWAVVGVLLAILVTAYSIRLAGLRRESIELE